MLWVNPNTLMVAGIAVFAAGSSCIETGVNPIDTDEPILLVLEVEPQVIHFGGVEAEASEVRTLSIHNVGDAGVPLDEISIDGSSAFTLVTPFQPAQLDAGESLDVEVAFSPSTLEQEATLVVRADLLDEPEIPVLLAGNGLFPMLEVIPSPWEFGAVGVCNSETLDVHLINRGDADLRIEDLVTTGSGMDYQLDETFPLVLPPAQHAEMTLTFTPERIDSYSGVAWIETNDLAGDRTIPWTGMGESLGISEYVDEFRQSDGPWDQADVFFYIDQSASMDDDRDRLIDAFSLLAQRLDDEDVHWQVMVATDDDGCANEGLISAGDPYAGPAFASAVWGPYGLLAESGLQIANNGLAATGMGQCNEGFLRDRSKTLLVMVSDEEDQSDGTWADQVSAILAKAPSASVIAVVGPVPGGCSSAEPGHGYYEAAMSTDGLAVSICSRDWSEEFDKVADLVDEPTDTFELSYRPDPDTLVVSLDGTEVFDWTYDADLNAVVFDTMPAAGALVRATYELTTEC